MMATLKALIFLLIIFLPAVIPIRNKKVNWGGDYNLLSFDYTNCLRGCAILLIMAGHFCSTMGVRWITPFGGIGVALFLFLSGFGCNESYKHKGLSSFWLKKIKRVLLPYAIVISLIYIISQNWDLRSYLLNITGLQTSYWYIAYLMKWYLVFWVATKFLFRYRIILLSIFAIVSFLFLPEIEAEQSLSFLFGVICSETLNRVRTISKSNLGKIAMISILIGATFLLLKQLPLIRLYQGTHIYIAIQLLIKLPFAICIIAVLSFMPILLRSSYLKFAGDLSYELYLVHFPFYIYLEGRLVLAIVLLISSFIMAYVFNRLNRKLVSVLS